MIPMEPGDISTLTARGLKMAKSEMISVKSSRPELYESGRYSNVWESFFENHSA